MLHQSVQIVCISPRYKLSRDQLQTHITFQLMMNFSMRGGYTSTLCAGWVVLWFMCPDSIFWGQTTSRDCIVHIQFGLQQCVSIWQTQKCSTRVVCMGRL